MNLQQLKHLGMIVLGMMVFPYFEAFASEYRFFAKIDQKDHSIRSLQWKRTLVPIEKVTDKSGKTFYQITLEGVFSDHNRSLLIGETKVKLNSDGRFAHAVPINHDWSTIPIRSIVNSGDLFQDTLTISVPFWKELTTPQKETRFSLNASLGQTAYYYREDLVEAYRMLALTPKFAFRWLFKKPRFDLESNFFFNLLPLAKSQSGITARQFGTNVRVGVLVTPPEKPYSITIAAGLYFTAMTVSGSAFGYGPLLYTQLYPTFRYLTRRNHLVGLYFKYVPMDRHFNPFKVKTREIATGFSWSMPVKSIGSLGASLDLSDMRFLLSDKRKSQTSTLSLSATWGYRF